MKWVKASERLPDSPGDYRVKHNSGRIHFSNYNERNGFELPNVIEWQDSTHSVDLEAAQARIAELEAEVAIKINTADQIHSDWCAAASTVNKLELENNRLSLNLKAATALLEELGEYMDARADSIDGETPRPNTEMCFSQSIDALLEKIKK